MVIRTGICVKDPKNLFTNGCYQQSLFIFNMLNKIDNVQCDLVTIDQSYKEFDSEHSFEVITLERNTIANYDIIFMLSLSISERSNPTVINWIKEFNVKLIDILCGNLFVLLQEEFVFNCHNIMKNYYNEAIDEVWVLEMYEYSKEFLELLYNKPVKVLPYVWDVDIIKNYIQRNDIQLIKHNTEKINICIFEPNMSIHKNALIPMLIAERFYRKYPNRLNKVFLFCKKEMHSNGYYENLKIYKDGKIEMHGRIIMPHTFKLIQRTSLYKNVVLSYTLLNNLNFIHLELFYMGIPIVHNCEPFDNDFRYDSEKLLDAVELLEKARISDVNKSKHIDIICKYNVRNTEIQKKWNDNIKTLIQN